VIDLGQQFIWGRARIDERGARELFFVIGLSAYLLMVSASMISVLFGGQGGLALIALVITVGPVVAAITLLAALGVVYALNGLNCLYGVLIPLLGLMLAMPAAAFLAFMSIPLGVFMLVVGPLSAVWFWRLAAQPLQGAEDIL
jgi:hypothetical protein